MGPKISPDKYVAADVHAASTTIVVRDATRRVVARALVETKAKTLVEFIRSLSGTVHLTFEEGTHAAWLYDLLSPLVAELVLCNPSRNRLLSDGNKSDDVDAEKLSELLMNGQLKPVYHGEHGTRRLKHLVAGHSKLVRDSIRTKNRLKAVFRSRGLAVAGKGIYNIERKDSWLEMLDDEGSRQRADWLYRELESIGELRDEAEKAVLREARKHPAARLLQSGPGIGPIRAAQLVGILASPHRFRNKRLLWCYAGFAVVTRSSSDYRLVRGELSRRKRPPSTRGLNRNHSPMVKSIFKGAALDAGQRELKPYYEKLLAHGMRPELARLTLARKIAAIVLTMWKKGERFDPTKIDITSGDMAPS